MNESPMTNDSVNYSYVINFIKSQKDESERDSGVVERYGGRSVSGEGMETAPLPTPLTLGISSIWLLLSCILL